MTSTASATSNNTKSTNDTSSMLTDADDVNMFQAARRSGRRNALGDIGEQLVQVDGSSSSDVDKMAPHFQSMSIKR